MDRYVVGFMFSPDKKKVALIKKNRPDWQKGKLNGIGGKIQEKDGYSFYINAMVREFEEETGLKTKQEDWIQFCHMQGTNDDKKQFSIQFFYSFGPLNKLKSMTDEKVKIFKITDFRLNCDKVVENVPWLLGLAYDCFDKRPTNVDCYYGP